MPPTLPGNQEGDLQPPPCSAGNIPAESRALARSVQFFNSTDHVQMAAAANSRLPPFPRHWGPRSRIQSWERLGAEEDLLRAIAVGVPVIITKNPPPLKPKDVPNPSQLLQELNKAVEQGSASMLDPNLAAETKTWTPTFLVPKKGSSKMRMISDLRGLNSVAPTRQFHPDGWKDLGPLLENPKLTWGASVDMQDWFHNLAVHPRARRWMRIRLGDQAWELRELPFGLNSAPWWSHRLSVPIIRHLRSLGIPLLWYVDDILLLGESREQVFDHVVTFLNLMTRLGLRVNVEKSNLLPAQTVPYLGHLLDLAKGKILPTPEKVDMALPLVKKLIPGSTCRPQLLASLAGVILDLSKSNTCLQGLPRRLMKSAGGLVRVPTPIVFSEANSFGLPVLTTDTGGISSIIRDDVNGRMFGREMDIKSCALYVSGLFTDPEE